MEVHCLKNWSKPLKKRRKSGMMSAWFEKTVLFNKSYPQPASASLSAGIFFSALSAAMSRHHHAWLMQQKRRETPWIK
ncbi:MAG: hypothetical protein IJN44_03920 [Clostridia bacterium]|nr:hypothetical protein [Clostridia bacterium]